MILKLIFALLFNVSYGNISLIIESDYKIFTLEMQHDKPYTGAEQEEVYEMDIDQTEPAIEYVETYKLSKIEAYLWALVIRRQLEQEKFNELKTPF